jgi:CRP/FNR family transcriptional regulator
LLGELKKEGHISMWEGKNIIHNLAHLKSEIKCEDCPMPFAELTDYTVTHNRVSFFVE